MTASGEQRFGIPAQVHARRFNDETVVLDLASGEYFALDEVGQEIWEGLSKGLSLGEVVERIVQNYDVDAQTAGADAERLVGELVAKGLLTRKE
jgi:hypothetical protein